jgi:class 3 adenylate cyclase
MSVSAPATDEGSARPYVDELPRHGPLGRFHGETEADYRRWAAREAFPVGRLLVWISMFIWLSVPFLAAKVVDTDEDLTTFRVVCWGVTVPVLVVGLALGERYWRMWLVTIGLAVTTFASLFLVTRMDVEQRPLLMVSMTVFCLYLAPLLRVPAATTAAYLALTVPAAVGWALRTADREGTWDGTLTIEIWLLGSSSAIVLAMSLVSESSARRRYADGRALERQQSLLSQSRELVRRYAPAAVVDRLEQGDATVVTAQRLRVTIFFADVVGFTETADRVDPEALAEIMDDYLGAAAEVVERHGGTLSEFAGDGVMAIFGAPAAMAPADQVRSAVAAATELQRTLPRLSQRWYPLGIDKELQARIGINTGVVSVGTFGSAVRATYTGMGMQTNIAARVQSHCPPGSVLLSSTSWHLVKDEVPCEPRGEIDVKGVHYPIAVYEPA